VLVVWKTDRLGRSLLDLVELVEDLKGRGVSLKVLTRQGASVDTTRPGGKLIFSVFGAMAEFERELIRERTAAGMKAAKRRGVHVGRPAKLIAHDIGIARQAPRWRTVAGRCRGILEGCLSTLRRHLNRSD
jgi:DNA invertase Pin-like site-specific DNA recombinase